MYKYMLFVYGWLYLSLFIETLLPFA